MAELDDRGCLELVAAIIVTARREAGQGREDAQRFMQLLEGLPRPRNMRLVEGADRRASENHPAGRRR